MLYKKQQTFKKASGKHENETHIFVVKYYHNGSTAVLWFLAKPTSSQKAHSQPTTREFGNRNQERRHRQEGNSYGARDREFRNRKEDARLGQEADSCSSRITKNTGTAQGISNRGRCVRTGAVPELKSL